MNEEQSNFRQPDMNSNLEVDTAVAEVLSSSITTIVAQAASYNLDAPPKPRFGSFLTIKANDVDLRVFAVIYDVITGAPDSVHKPVALGMTRERLRTEQPHIFSLLKTEIHAAIIGFETAGLFRHYLPPHAADVHDFVYNSKVEEIKELTTRFEFLRLLMHINSVPTDELLAAAIREAHVAVSGTQEYLVRAGQALAQLLHNDYDRLLSLLTRIRPQE